MCGKLQTFHRHVAIFNNYPAHHRLVDVMTSSLRISIGQHSDKGCKQTNQDFYGACLPQEPQLSAKGVAIALADGISSSDVSQVASQFAVTSFLEDYYCTSDAWSVRISAERVLRATNSWLHAQTRQSRYRYDKDRGYVCTFSALVIKSSTAYVFHAGDTRIYHLRAGLLEQLTEDHRVSVSSEHSYLARAFGIDNRVEIDHRSVQVEPDDVFVLATDGVYEHVDNAFIMTTIERCTSDLDEAARHIVEEALQRGSDDNLTIQIVRVETLPEPGQQEVRRQSAELPCPSLLAARMQFDGHRIVRELHVSSRSHVYLAVDDESGEQVVIKTPSIDLRGDPAYLERFLLEEWIARRIDSPHVLKPVIQTRKRNYLYVAMEFVSGQTLAQWMIDNPKPKLETVRAIVEQIAKGLRAFHRMEMLQQDLRPENIMIDETGTVKIIDFGATRVAGISEGEEQAILGTVQYAAPEYFTGQRCDMRSDLFSLGVITYQMLCGRLPYGTAVAKLRGPADLSRLNYHSLQEYEPMLPSWVDAAIRRAVHPNANKRHEDVAEFVYDLYHPNPVFLCTRNQPLIERSPLAFWKGLSFALLLIVVALLGALVKLS